jgi:hypothetical protein
LCWTGDCYRSSAADQLESVNDRYPPGCRRSISLARRHPCGRMRTVKVPFWATSSQSPRPDRPFSFSRRSLAIARIAIAKDPATSGDRFVAATVARSTREAVTRAEKGAVSAPNHPLRSFASPNRAAAVQREPPLAADSGPHSPSHERARRTVRFIACRRVGVLLPCLRNSLTVVNPARLKLGYAEFNPRGRHQPHCRSHIANSEDLLGL